ncbi:helix-hairpin-helix domain-containing protein [Flexithrix dorotheae]|uniref:helix-hairpin-helix domain-containing protein n=1 Tax=Flexithrix dorotheae TaxID=70993 RepID=UPI000475A866|nr:helix-hairpin-helix domain-containing protein [Flexithrix dorotheae]
MNEIKNWIKSYFSFSNRETNGFVVLVIIMAILLMSPFCSRFLMKKPAKNWDSDLEKLEILAAQLEPQFTAKKAKKEMNSSKTSFPKKVVKYFNFNPNEISLSEWEKLGVATYLGKRILKYVEKGGSFKIKSDLKKIYGFPEEAYSKLEPYIDLPEAFSKKEKFKAENKTYPDVKKHIEKTEVKISSFDINKADTTTLKQIRGIGSKLSTRIVKFRDKLGGFHSLEQVKEVYGLKEEVYLSLIEKAEITDLSIQKININRADETMLKSHPYIDWKLAKIIVNYRKQHGNYNSIEDLKKIKIVTEELAIQVQPYISFQ